MQRPIETVSGAGGLGKLVLTASTGARAEVYLHGAHLTSWIPGGESEAMFLSRAARFSPDSSIRGGIPVVFPQFADLGAFTRHGFARTQEWELAGSTSPAQVTLRLRDSEATRALWPHAFVAELSIEIAERKLALTLSILNSDRKPFEFTAALHTYFRVGDVERIRLLGLQGVKNRNRASWEQIRAEASAELAIAGEVDRVYMDAPSSVTLRDPGIGRTLRIAKEGFRDTVLWNPGPAASLADLESSEYREMVCVEAAQVMQPVTLPPGERWNGSQRLELE